MKFRFPFEKILAHRISVEEIARRDWLLAKAAVEEAEAGLKRMFDEIIQAHTRAGLLVRGGGRPGPDLQQIDSFLGGQRVRVELQRRKIRDLLARLEEQQERLTEAARDRKTMERLKERRLAQFKLKAKKQELKAVDEIVVTRFKSGGQP